MVDQWICPILNWIKDNEYIATWLIAIGTLLALGIPLWLAWRKRKIKIIISAECDPDETHAPSFFQIYSTSECFFPVTICKVYLRIPPLNDEIDIPLDPIRQTASLSTKLPAKLEYGERARFYWSPLENSRFNLNTASQLRESICRFLMNHVLKYGVKTTNGRRFERYAKKVHRQFLTANFE